jgi:hypothetical protein
VSWNGDYCVGCKLDFRFAHVQSHSNPDPSENNLSGLVNLYFAVLALENFFFKKRVRFAHKSSIHYLAKEQSIVTPEQTSTTKAQKL